MRTYQVSGGYGDKKARGGGWGASGGEADRCGEVKEDFSGNVSSESQGLGDLWEATALHRVSVFSVKWGQHYAGPGLPVEREK